MPVSGQFEACEFARFRFEPYPSFVSKPRKTRAIAVQLSPQTVKKLDDLAGKSGMSRHRYMILILERALKANVTVREEIAFSNAHP